MNKIGDIIKFIGKTLAYVILCLLFLITAFLIYYMSSSAIAAKKGEKPNIGLYTIVSPSMEPFIKVYDVIIDRKLKSTEELKVGDVITFYSSSLDTDGYTITHRIYDIKVSDGKTYYITKGDNNQSVDIGSITRENIVGKMIYKINGLGKIQFFLSSKLGWILIILIPALCFILYDLNKLMDKIEKMICKIQEKDFNELNIFNKDYITKIKGYKIIEYNKSYTIVPRNWFTVTRK